MSEDIIAFVQKQKDGARWTDLENEFLQRGWSKGKFVNHWKEAKEMLVRVFDKKTGRPKYYLREEFAEEAEKAILKKDLEEARLIRFPIDERDKLVALHDLNKHYRNRFIVRKGIRGALKLIWKSSEDTVFFLNQWVNFQVKDDSSKFKINLMFPEGAPPIKLEEDQVIRLIQVMALSGLGRKDPYKIILIYDPGSKRTEKEREKDEFEGFTEWLRKFKGKEIDDDLGPYIIGEKTQDTELLEPEKIKKLIEYLQYYKEFNRKCYECDKMLLSKK